jgi:mRNA interferase MazF
MKRFLEWIGLKEKLHSSDAQPPLVKERDIWWASIGENVGSEINGKNDLFSRPVIIFRKLAHGFYFVIPTTTRVHEGSWYVPFRHRGKDTVACLHQARAIDYRRLSSKLGTIDTNDFRCIQEGFIQLYVKNIPRSFKRGRG